MRSVVTRAVLLAFLLALTVPANVAYADGPTTPPIRKTYAIVDAQTGAVITHLPLLGGMGCE